ncbi:hypothetical protein J6590_019574 [Homalodisca vitripennis]|nr:hypothetical protein J6590_019574 [Homalodisca vitripennis]
MDKRSWFASLMAFYDSYLNHREQAASRFPPRRSVYEGFCIPLKGYVIAIPGEQRKMTDWIFLYKLLHSVHCPSLLQKTNPRMPVNTRSQNLFEIVNKSHNYLEFSHIPLLRRFANDVCSPVAFFGGGIVAFTCAVSKS